MDNITMIKYFSLPLLLAVTTAVVLTGCKPAKPKTEQCRQIVSAATCDKIGQLLIVGFGGMDQTPQGKGAAWNDPPRHCYSRKILILLKISLIGMSVELFILELYYTIKKMVQLIRNRNISKAASSSPNYPMPFKLITRNSREQQKLSPLPLIITLDQEGGVVNPLVFAAGLPNYTPESLGKNESMNSSDPQKLQNTLDFTLKYAQTTGAFLRKYGINLNFAPDVD